MPGAVPTRWVYLRFMSRNGPAKMDVRTAWNTWTTSGSPEAAAEFLERVGAWTDGTAAQLTRGGRGERPLLTREEVVDRLKYHLGVLAAGGDPVTYAEALELARKEVIEELRRRPA
ncbi:MAG: hypothetical protein QOE80_2100 [Actinomycetota bacterium]|nr:hypothetical protein [Actinomycetota bacterium]